MAHINLKGSSCVLAFFRRIYWIYWEQITKISTCSNSMWIRTISSLHTFHRNDYVSPTSIISFMLKDARFSNSSTFRSTSDLCRNWSLYSSTCQRSILPAETAQLNVFNPWSNGRCERTRFWNVSWITAESELLSHCLQRAEGHSHQVQVCSRSAQL